MTAENKTNATVQLKSPAQEQTNDPDVIQSSVDKRALQIGDVAGVTFELPEKLGSLQSLLNIFRRIAGFEIPENLERLQGWLVYNFDECGTPQFMEPIESAPEGLVNWKTGVNHVEKTLKKKGHKAARLWTETDGAEIFNNVVKGGHNDKAQLDVTGVGLPGGYWGSDKNNFYPDRALVYRLDDGYTHWIHDFFDAHVRAVQDVPELAEMLVTPKI